MKLLSWFYRRETRSPMLALSFASFICVALVVARIITTRDVHWDFLIWNLFLAWLPLIFAILACDQSRAPRSNNWKFGSLVGMWLLFFPNAPYICTDLIHLVYRSHRYFWVDLMLILLTALIGLVLGFLSLYLMQSLVRRRWGVVAGWLFVAGVAGLSSFGIYLGRFLRFNSWDVIARPVKLYQGITNWAANPLANSNSSAFPFLFAIFLLLAYVMLYTLTHLQPAQHLAAAPDGQKLSNA